MIHPEWIQFKDELPPQGNQIILVPDGESPSGATAHEAQMIMDSLYFYGRYGETHSFGHTGQPSEDGFPPIDQWDILFWLKYQF